ncbi:hypothetical protein PMI16_04561 [Herbaspirillum sp. CF444]|uniref:hypothetical protein n=1 Tax=Herbaspirillum sp. CF444 TaxID=1144319 RepID=UPI00027279A6|nr:hypothetical protein [Herbaspirillum sp. CF444]EJL81929.1 hypothetical protein PMI16_04561 [Herbaspirillum sp. CF444]
MTTQNTLDTSGASAAAARSGASQAIAEQEAIAAAKTDLNNVAVFTKFIKKAEEAAQSAI